MKKRTWYLITGLAVVFCTIAIFTIYNSNQIKGENVDYVEVTLSKVSADTMNKSLNFSINNSEDIEDIINLEKELFWYSSAEGTNSIRWEATFNFHLKNGDIVKKDYSKIGNTEFFFSKYLKYLND